MGLASAIRAGQAYIEVFLEDSMVTKGLGALEGQLEKAGRRISELGSKAWGGEIPEPLAAVGRFIASPAGIVTGLVEAARKSGEAGEAMADLAEKAGTSVETISALSYAARRSSVDVSELAAAFRKMQVTLAEAGNGKAGGLEALQSLGLSFADLAALSPADQFKRIADAIAAIPDPMGRSAAAVAMFGRSGTDMLPMLLKGSSGIQALEEDAAKLGLVMSKEAAEGGKEFAESWGKMTDVLKSAVTTIGSGVTPQVENLTKWVTGGAGAARDWVKDHQGVVATAFTMAGSMVAAGAGITTVGKSVKELSEAIGMVKTAIEMLKTAAAFLLLTPQGLLMLAGAAVIAATAYGVLGDSMRAMGDSMQAVADQAARNAEAQQNQRNATLGQMEYLERLARQERLTNEEQTRAESIVRSLTDTYGDLGLQIDSVTGKITGMGDAQRRVVEQMRAAELTEQKAILAEREGNLENARQQFRSVQHNKTLLTDEDFEKARRPLDAAEGLVNATKMRIAALSAGGEVGAATPFAAGDTSGEAQAKTWTEYRAKMDEELFRVHLQQIEDEEARAIAAINHKWDAEMAAAVKAGANMQEVEDARNREIAAKKAEYAKKAAKDEDKLHGDLLKAAIGATMEGTQQELAMLEVDRQAAIKEAQDAGKSDDYLEQLNQLYDFKGLAAGNKGNDITSQGAFVGYGNASMIFGGGGVGPIESMNANIGKLPDKLDAVVQGLADVKQAVAAGQLWP